MNPGEGSGLDSRMGLLNTNSNQHDQGWAGTNKYNMTNKFSRHSPSDNAPTPTVGSKYQRSSDVSVAPASSALLSPCLVWKVTKVNHLNDISISRSDSRSSSCSSAETVCGENDIFPYGKGIKPNQRIDPSKSLITSKDLKYAPEVIKEVLNNNSKVATAASLRDLESESSEKVRGGGRRYEGVKAGGEEMTPDLEIDKLAPHAVVSSDRRGAATTTNQNINKPRMDLFSGGLEDDNNSVSTVSGSGIDFFRKFVQRKASSCKDCEEQFRREVLIDRLVSDSINTKAVLGLVQRGSSRFSVQSSTDPGAVYQHPPGSDVSDNTQSTPHHSLLVSSLGMQEMEEKARACQSRCKSHRNSVLSHDDLQSLSTKSSLSRSSSISGSGLLFLRNYLKKKKSKSKAGQSEGNNKEEAKNISAFNIVPVPFPPPSDFYGPAYLPDEGQDISVDDESSSGRRSSLCSTVADLLNEDFDCDDSELKNLDWEEWDEPLPDEISYDDLVSVISESFYSEDLDISDLCEIDWEGRKTVVAAENQVISPDDRVSDSQERSKSNNVDYLTGSPLLGATEILSPTKSKYSNNSYKSRSNSAFLQDLASELELPPMTPVSDEKEEAVRALSRTIKQYMRTGSNSSYTSNNDNNNSSAADKRHSRLSNYHNDQTNLFPGKTAAGEELERNSRMSVCSPAMSDYLPELVSTSSTCVSPQHHRRPLSQLLIYDGPESHVSSPGLTRPVSAYHPHLSISSRFSRERSSTPSPELRPGDHTPAAPGAGCSVSGGGYHQFSQDSCSSAKHDSAVDSGAGAAGAAGETLHQPRLLDHLRLRSESGAVKAANRDSLLCPYTPPLCSSPALHAPHPPVLSHSPNVPVSRHPYLRHSSVHSTDSGCHVFEEKLASVSPTPSPRTNIETVLNSNRNKLSSFWEKSISNSVIDVHRSWLPNKDEHSRHGFKPFKSTFGSENSLNFVTDRLAHFQDMTRRAAERNSSANNAAPAFRRSHRASTGSDCSDLFLDKITLSPVQPRRRESFTEYFV